MDTATTGVRPRSAMTGSLVCVVVMAAACGSNSTAGTSPQGDAGTSDSGTVSSSGSGRGASGARLDAGTSSTDGGAVQTVGVDGGSGTCGVLGFTHHWGLSRKGKWVVRRRIAKDRYCRRATAGATRPGCRPD
jgi:hypothetical protein